jgi:type IV secretory pathway VirJ component
VLAAVLAVAALLGACRAPPAPPSSPARAAPAALLAPGLPLVLRPADQPGRAFVVLLSGDGGWARFDRDLADALAGAGLPVVGWNARSYFGAPRTPAAAAVDLERVIETYAARSGRDRVVLVGFSFGADTLPFMIERLPGAVRRRASGVALIAPTELAQFHFVPVRWLVPARQGLPVAPAIGRLDPARTLCAYGLEDDDSVCAHLPGGSARILARPGGHHMSGGGDPALARAILQLAQGADRLAR